MFKIKKIFINTSVFLLMVLSTYQVCYARSAVLQVKNDELVLNTMPLWLVIKDAAFYDADSDDLVTAGVGFSKLSQAKIEDKFVNPNSPSVYELRRAKLNRYIDTRTGEGTYWGFKKQDLTPLFDGKVAGNEIQAYMIDGDNNVALLLQIPLDFDQDNPCIVAVPTMDSQGIYNAKDIQIRGLWGLKHNCAVVYNDKGLGNALFDLSNNEGYMINGQVANKSVAHDELLFSPDSAFKHTENTHDRFAPKQLYSKHNPEQKWGQYVLNSIEFVFYQLNEMFSPTHEVLFNKDNTHVLVYGVSDGAGAALKAGELDLTGIIDGIVAVNPQIQIHQTPLTPLFIQYGQTPKVPLETKSLIDYSSYAALYLPCAVLAIKEQEAYRSVPDVSNFFFANNRCNALKEAGLLTSESTAEQAKEALQKLYQYGWTKEMAYQLPHYYYSQSINLPYQYISEYGRYGLDELLCDYSVASTNQEPLFNTGQVAPLTKTQFARLWVNNSGSLPIRLNNDIIAIDLVNNNDPTGARREFYSHSPNSDVIDYNLAGAMCLRDTLLERRVNEGLFSVLASGKLNQIKTIIVHGQLNVRHLPDFSARAYVALNSYVEGSFSNLRYIEVENASYLDSAMPFDNVLIPIDYYGENAMDWLWRNLTKNTSLPDSQIMKTQVRGGNIGFAPAITDINIPPIMQSAKQANRIKLDNGTIILPN